MHVVVAGRTSLTNTLDSNTPLVAEEDDPVPVEVPVPLPVEAPVPVPVPVEEDAEFCKSPRSISDPLFRTIPCNVTDFMFVPKASINVTVMVQFVFRVYFPARAALLVEFVTAVCPGTVGDAKMSPAPSKYRVPDDAKGAMDAKPPNRPPNSVFE